MKTTLRILIIFTFLSIVFLPAAQGKAQATRIEFTGQEWCDPATLLAERLWMAGPNLKVRDWAQTCVETADISQMNGTNFINNALANIGKNYIVNAKFRLETTEGGVWVGTCEWPANTQTIMCVGHGEGQYEGLELHWFATPNFGEPQPFNGYIIDHR